MAKCYTPLPKHKGELDLAKQLISLPDDKLHLWFSLDYIPGVEDIDILLWHESAGVFIIEVKSIPISLIKEFSLYSCKIEGRPIDRGPHYQAHRAHFSFRKFLSGYTEKVPWIISTACFPLISRSEWDSTWANPMIIGDFAKKLIFEEDLYSSNTIFIDRLKFIYNNPPIRGGSDRPFFHNIKDFEIFLSHMKNLSEPDKPRVSPSELEKLKTLEMNVKKQTLDEITKSNEIYTLYTGYPGTGKTFRLLHIAIHFALNKKSVILFCYNKTLASDINRLLHSMEILRSVKSQIIVIDLFEVLINESAQFGIKSFNNDYKLWAELITEELKKQFNTLPKYDIILVDEAQDMDEWAFDLLSLYASKTTRWFIATGTGQELYNSHSFAFEKIKLANKPKRLNRNFRNTLPIFQMSQVFYECVDSPQNINKTLNKFSSNRFNTQEEIIFSDRPTGSLPKVVNINDNDLDWSALGTTFFDQEQNEIFSNEYKRIISTQYNNLTEKELPIDILILVPSTESQEYYWCKSALHKLEFTYTDYVNEDNRRTIAPVDKIRLCTYHSSRGLEGNRVIVFGFEFVHKLATAIDLELKNLGYIVLSRAVFDLIFAFRNNCTSFPREFVYSVLKEMNKELNKELI